MTYVYLCDYIRTPIGRHGGALSKVRPDDLAALPLAELLRRNPGFEPKAIEEVWMGCANQAGEDNRNVARMAALLAGLIIGRDDLGQLTFYWVAGLLGTVASVLSAWLAGRLRLHGAPAASV